MKGIRVMFFFLTLALVGSIFSGVALASSSNRPIPIDVLGGPLRR